MIAKKPSAAHISRVLREAGYAKAGRYTAWGHVDREGHLADGFVVITSTSTPPKVSVTHTDRFAQRQWAPRYEATLRAAGYDATARRRASNGELTGWVDVS